MATLSQCIARGVRLLNKKCPGWFKKVRITDLDIGNNDFCVLGQLGHQTLTSMERFITGRSSLVINQTIRTLINYGFFPCSSDPELTELWRNKIRLLRRKAARKPLTSAATSLQ